jgi:hypothetical protein
MGIQKNIVLNFNGNLYYSVYMPIENDGWKMGINNLKIPNERKMDSIPVSSPKITKSLGTVSIKMESENVLLTLK